MRQSHQGGCGRASGHFALLANEEVRPDERYAPDPDEWSISCNACPHLALASVVRRVSARVIMENYLPNQAR